MNFLIQIFFKFALFTVYKKLSQASLFSLMSQPHN